MVVYLSAGRGCTFRDGPSEDSGHCAECVRGRGRNMRHMTRDATSDATPVLSWDYGLLSSNDDDAQGGDGDREAEASGQSPVLCMRDRASHAVF